MLHFLVFVAACTTPDEEAHSKARPWSKLAPALDGVDTAAGFDLARTIVHLHSPWSHDACDDLGIIDGAANPTCLADLRRGLCEARVDVAFLTDHPAYGADRPYDELFHLQAGDAFDGHQARWQCDGHQVSVRVGFEDTLMPIGLDHFPVAKGDKLDELIADEGSDSIAQLQGAGAMVLAAHAETRTTAWLEDAVTRGLEGLEVFSIHAAFDPDLRQKLGFDPFGSVSGLGPFLTGDDGTPEPDLLFLTVLEEQALSMSHWDRVNASAPVLGFGGTDAHQNLMDTPLADGERVDSYRRLLRWMSNIVQHQGDPEAALRQGQNFVVFEILGLPDHLDFALVDAQGESWPMGSRGTPAGTLQVPCIGLGSASPQNDANPEVSTVVYKDGLVFAEQCGEIEVTAPGVYRFEVSMVPHHLQPFLGEQPEAWLRPYPWIFSNAIEVQ